MSKGRWHQAVLFWVAARQYQTVINTLTQHELYDIAYLFRLACKEVWVG